MQSVIETDMVNVSSSAIQAIQELLKEKNLPEGTVILAKNQEQGKGQNEQSWETSGSFAEFGH